MRSYGTQHLGVRWSEMSDGTICFVMYGYTGNYMVLISSLIEN